eukprot:scaffold32169_cov50-Phaeocystis_antarctica.AAC.4
MVARLHPRVAGDLSPNPSPNPNPAVVGLTSTQRCVLLFLLYQVSVCLAWQDFREGFRPGIGREEWTRAYG